MRAGVRFRGKLSPMKRLLVLIIAALVAAAAIWIGLRMRLSQPSRRVPLIAGAMYNPAYATDDRPFRQQFSHCGGSAAQPHAQPDPDRSRSHQRRDN